MSPHRRLPSGGRKSPHHEAVARFEALQAEAPSLDARPLVRSWERIARIRALGSQPPPLAPEWPGAPEKPYSREARPFATAFHVGEISAITTLERRTVGGPIGSLALAGSGHNETAMAARGGEQATSPAPPP